MKSRHLYLIVFVCITGILDLYSQTILREVYTNITGSTIADLTASPKFPYFPDLRTYQTNFEAPTSFGDYYGTRMRGYVLPPQTGNYIFWIASDDNSQLYLSVDDSPYKTKLIAYVRTYTSSRQWTKETNQQSQAIYLEAGKRYYVEALQKEGTGGDNLAVGWQLPDGTLERPIPGNRLQPWIISTNPPTILSQPADTTVSDEETAAFHVEAVGAEPLYYQWFRDGALLEKETYPTLFLDVVSTLDNGARFFCIISNSLGSVTSRIATLYVYAETNPPVVVVLNPPAGSTVRQLSQIEILFNEPVTGVKAQDLLINGAPATNVTGFSAGIYTFMFAPQPPGNVHVEWSATQNIIDDSLAANRFTGGSWSYTVNPNHQYPEVVITEFVAGNENGLRDESGETQDWIELQNRSSSPVNLEGWSLSDDQNVPGKWVFPPKILQPGEFLVVFASGKDIKASGTNYLHTNFKLSRDGEFLGLFTPEVPRTMASGFPSGYPEQRNDYSYGLDLNGQWRYFATPTPWQSNGVSTIYGVVESVHCSVDRGVFDRPFKVVLSTRTAGAQIRYTTNGSEPNATNGTVYTEPIQISYTTILRAAAFKENMLPSKTITRSYFFNLSPTIMSLPIMSLVTATNNLIGPTGIIGIGGGYYSNGVWYPLNPEDYHNPSKHGREWERPVSVEYIDTKNNSGFQADAGIRVHGANYIRPRYKPDSKFSFRLYFRGDYGPTKLNYPLFPSTSITTFDQIVLRAGMNDPVNPFIRDELARRLGLDQGQVEVSGTFVNLFINGEYKGYYNPTERVISGTLQAHHGGGEDWDLITVGSVAQEGDTIEWNSLRNYVNVADVTQPAIYKNIMRRFDVTNFVDYLLLKHFTGGGDWPHNNWRAARERSTNGIFRYYLWDDEWGFGYNNRSPSLNLFTNELAGSSEVAGFYKRLILNPEFRQLWIDRTHKHYFNGGALTDENALKRHDELRAIVSGVISNFNPTIATNWIARRRPYVLQQFAERGLLGSSNAPVFNKFGGVVQRGFQLTLSNMYGTIYFTTNGDDPRVMFSGEIAPTALAYTNGVPIRLTRSAFIRARTYEGTNWSALTEAEFKVEEMGIPLRITEIMYNPPGGTACEYIEILNIGAAPIDLSGMSFTGIEYMFPFGVVIKPWQSIVLVSDINPSAFFSLYPNATVVGYFKKSLSNNGEFIALKDKNGNIVCSVEYKVDGYWQPEANGSGYSLEMIDPLGDPADPANWRRSVSPGGSPGQLNPPQPPPRVRFNEFMVYNLSVVSNGNSYPDWIELYNDGDSPVNLAGWSLTDSENPRKFVFPTGTLIEPRGFLVVWCDKNYIEPGLHTGFSLKKEGQTLRLFDENTNRIDIITYGQQIADYSAGIDTNGNWVLCQPTPGLPNIPAPTASYTNLFINEWLANALPSESDWIEIFNRHPSLPISLKGIFIGHRDTIDRVYSLSFIAPGGFFLLYADENIGQDHLRFKLSAEGGIITLYDPTGVEIHKVIYSAMPENTSRGSYPNGSQYLYNFTASKTPGETNYLTISSAIRFYEMLALNKNSVTNFAGIHSDFLEIENRAGYAVDLTGYSISIKKPEPGQWRFPSGLVMAPRSYLVIWCDPTLPPMNSASNALNTGRGLDADGGSVYLYGADNKLLDYIEYGNQIADKPLGRSPSAWKLLAFPTPGTTNAPPEYVAPTPTVLINEWMADNPDGDDWIELYNPSTNIVDMSGCYITDDPSIFGLTNHLFTPFTVIPPKGWIRLVADENLSAGQNHVRLKLNKDGDTIRIYSPAFALLDSIEFGLQQPGVSQGRYPDGSSNIIYFPYSPTPGSMNRLDSDGDGMPDEWELANEFNPFNNSDASVDSDGDGVTNYEEFLAGTDPHNQNSVLKLNFSMDSTNRTLKLMFYAAPSRAYSIEHIDTLGKFNWSNYIDINPLPVGQDIELLIPYTNNAQRFFRVITR